MYHTVHTAMKAEQPHGPYVIAGYSHGFMLTFEIAKWLERDGDQIRVEGCFNLPPHIKVQIRQLDLMNGLTHLAYFSGLITEEMCEDLRGVTVQHTLDRVLGV